MKKRYAVSLLLVVLTVVISRVCVKQISPNPFGEVSTYQELVALAGDVPVYSFDLENENYGEEMLRDIDRIFEKLDGNTILTKSEPQILVVTAGSYFRQNGSTYQHTANIDRVIQGDTQHCNQEIFLSLPYGVMPGADKDTFMFWGTKGQNVLIFDHQYLVFCEKNEVSDYLDKPAYRGLPMSFGYLDLTSNESKLVDLNDNRCENYIGSEFFVNRQETLDALLTIKSKIIERYYPDFQ